LVGFWHLVDIDATQMNVCFEWQRGRREVLRTEPVSAIVKRPTLAYLNQWETAFDRLFVKPLHSL
jgi:hypothetical protein